MDDRRLGSFREVKPTDRDWLHAWVLSYTGVRLARNAVCKGHHAPFDVFATQCLERPPITLTLGSRGSGKSFGSALNTHFVSRFNPGSRTRILGGSAAQSQQIYDAIKSVALDGHGPLGSDGDSIDALLERRCRYANGSDVSILACSSRAVRGPHIPSLKLDEVDEIGDEFREASLGMCMAKGDLSAAIDMTSTWHNAGGPMGRLVDQAKSGAFPLFTFCAFEVLEHCPESRSGPWVGGADAYERCPECPLFKWCHEDRQNDRTLPPKAKLADGHYAIESLIQKTALGSPRIFAADYLCKGPQAEGLWFKEFDAATHVSVDADYRPGVPVHIAIDSGVHTGAVWFQVTERIRYTPAPSRLELPGEVIDIDVNVFADFYAEGRQADQNAIEMQRICESLCQNRRDHVTTDPAGNSRTSTGGPTTLAMYASAGLKAHPWPVFGVADGLSLVESFVKSADGVISLRIHPRCKTLIAAFQNYRRAKQGGAWTDRPVDPQHPHEDMIDPLRGGLVAKFPSGRKPAAKFTPKPGRSILY